MSGSSASSRIGSPTGASGAGVIPIDATGFHAALYVTGKIHHVKDLTDTEETRLDAVKRAYDEVIRIVQEHELLKDVATNTVIGTDVLEANIFADTGAILYREPSTGALILIDLHDDNNYISIDGLEEAMDQFRAAMNATKIFDGVIGTTPRAVGAPPRSTIKSLDSSNVFTFIPQGTARDFAAFRDHIMKPYFEKRLADINAPAFAGDRDAAKGALRGEMIAVMREVALLDKRRALLLENFEEMKNGNDPNYTDQVQALREKIEDADLFALYFMILRNQAEEAARGAPGFDANAVREAAKNNIHAVIESKHPDGGFAQRTMHGWFGSGENTEVIKMEERAYIERVLSPGREDRAFEHTVFGNLDPAHMFIPFTAASTYFTVDVYLALNLIGVQVDVDVKNFDADDLQENVNYGGAPELDDEPTVQAVIDHMQRMIDEANDPAFVSATI